MSLTQTEGEKKVKSLNRVRLFLTPWTVAYQAPLSMGFSRQEYCSGSPFPSPGNLVIQRQNRVFRVAARRSLPGSAGKKSACNAGDLGLIPGSGRSPGKGKRLPTPVFWPGEFHGLYRPWGHKESDTTELLSLSQTEEEDALKQKKQGCAFAEPGTMVLKRLWPHSGQMLLWNHVGFENRYLENSMDLLFVLPLL